MGTKIIYEDKNFLALNKPAGLLVHPHTRRPRAEGHGVGVHKLSSGNIHGKREKTLADWLVSRYLKIKGVGGNKERPGIVHRLDKFTSGVMVVAKTDDYFNYLSRLFKDRRVKKTYFALVYGELGKKSGTINAAIGVVAGSVRRSLHSEKMVKEAITEYKVRKTIHKGGGVFSFLEVVPKTGRTHQIRIHLASIGHPVLGDNLYGGSLGREDFKRLGRYFLHAESLEFNLKEGSRIKLAAELPPEFAEFVQN